MTTPNQNSGPKVTPDYLKSQNPLSPEDQFALESNRVIEARVSEVVARVSTEMSARGYRQIKTIAGHADKTLDQSDQFDRVAAAAAVRASAELKAQPPLYAEVATALVNGGVAVPAAYVPAEIEAKLQTILEQHMKIGVDEAMRSVYRKVINADLRAFEREKLQAEQQRIALEERRLKLEEERAKAPPGPSFAERMAHHRSEPAEKPENAKPTLTPEQAAIREQEAWTNDARVDYFSRALTREDINLNEWIQNSGLKDPSPLDMGEAEKFEAELVKLRKVGVWQDPDDTQGLYSRFFTKPSYFKMCRVGMIASWVVTGTVIAAAAIGIGPASLLFWAPAMTSLNLLMQKIIQFNHNRKFTSMFEEIKRELEGAGPMEAGIAWAGVMIKFLKDYRPLILMPERTDLLKDHDSMSVDAILKQLRQGAAFAAQSIQTKDKEGNKQNFFKDTKFNDYIKQNDAALKALAERWVAFPDRSLGFAKVGTAAGLFGGWVSIF